MPHQLKAITERQSRAYKTKLFVAGLTYRQFGETIGISGNTICTFLKCKPVRIKTAKTIKEGIKNL